jgi:hypothetical protein
MMATRPILTPGSEPESGTVCGNIGSAAIAGPPVLGSGISAQMTWTYQDVSAKMTRKIQRMSRFWAVGGVPRTRSATAKTDTSRPIG